MFSFSKTMFSTTTVTLLFVLSLSVGLRAVPLRTTRGTIPENYEVVTPQIIADDGQDLRISLSSESYDFTLTLRKNEYLIPHNFKSYFYADKGGKESFTKGHENCFYQGLVEGHSDWKATVSTCHGLQGEFGDFHDKRNHFHLKPLTADQDAVHILFRDTEVETETGICGSNHSHIEVATTIMNSNAMDNARVRRQTSSCQQRIVELVAVNDFAQYNLFNRDISSVVMRALAVTNIADALFQPLGIRVVLVAAVTWTSGDRITVTSNAEGTLNSFQAYKPQITAPHDAAMLLTGVDIAGNQVGIAFQRAMCNENNAALLVQDGGTKEDTVVGAIMAHELGHNFNMQHDDGCCSDPSGTCIMAAISGIPPPTMWSSCSRNELSDGFTRHNLDRCLCNQPQMIVGDPVCGNGIREGDEVCDCGSPDECIDPCCDARTCRLAAGAQCSAGECCTRACQFREYGTQCRSASGECDIAEYCSGDFGECPVDDHKLDGTSCNNDAGYCYAGSCPSHDGQCQEAFGSQKAVDQCYDQANTRGNQFGNCGSTTSSYTACSPSNVQCGQLQCMEGDLKVEINDLLITTGTLTLFIRGSPETCRSFTTQPDADVISPGLVSDGTKCGNGRACLSQECVPATQLTSMSCDRGTNGELCSGNGICNNRGRCSCDVGFSGSLCQTRVGENVCETDNGGCEHTCTSSGDSVECSCRSGYVLAGDGKNCDDIDECATNNGGCSQECTNTDGSFQCSCRSGFTLETDRQTCTDINECSTNNGGCSQVCTNSAGSFQCSCRSGFALNSDGRTCTASEVDECATNNGGCSQVCTNTDGSFQCSCRSGYTLENDGQTCTDIDECATNSGGCSQVCTNTDGSFQCSCRNGFTLENDGQTCTDVNECSTNNGGCSQVCTNTVGSFRCSCRSGYRLEGDGRSCTDVDECSSDSHNCQQRCINSQGSFSCGCNAGFSLNSDGRTCTDVKECSANNGGCEHICTETGGSFQCSCRSGYTLENDGQTCTDINECATNNGGCSQECTNTVGSFQCSCRSGYTLENDGQTCTDINECSTNNGGCSQVCTNTVGSFGCSCRSGYRLEGDGRSCSDIDECSSDSHNCQQRCINSQGSFSCGCNAGFSLNSDGRTCADVKECSVSNGGCDHICTETGGSFECSCRSGYTLENDGQSCTDIDECATNNGGCSQVCTNTDGSFQCSCRSGYTLENDGQTCTDINECATNSVGCSQECTNTDGSFQCSCRSGFTLENDGQTCTDIDECATNNGGCSQVCSNTVGSFRCSCRSGYRLEGDGRSCTDIDECSSDSHNCQQRCINSQGSFSCGCNAGFSLNSDGRTCTDVKECSANNGGCDHICTETGGSFQCSCRGGYTLENDGQTCTDIDECATNNGGCSQECTNTDGSFQCSCRSGFTLEIDGQTCTDINECSTNNGGCSQVCTNTVGSFRCSCRSGYRSTNDRRSCTDIDECEIGFHNCEHRCINSQGSFSCACISGFILNSDGRTCTFDSANAPTKLNEVVSFCSAIAWRRPNLQCNISVTGYEVQFYIPGLSQTVLRHVEDANVYHYSVQDKDKLTDGGGLLETLVRVRALSGSDVFGQWSDGIPLACEDSCSASSNTDTTIHGTTADLGVQLYFKGQSIKNGSFIRLTDVGEGDDALMCVTNKPDCCGTPPDRMGEFYYPNGVQVPIRARGHGFYRNRGDQVVRLNRKEDITHPTGWYRCEVPNASGEMHKVFAYLEKY